MKKEELQNSKGQNLKPYLDNAATTKVDKKVASAMAPYFSDNYGNASSLHHKGIEAKNSLEKARKIIAKSINALPEEIIFTSSGTESNNLAIKGIAFANKDNGNKFPSFCFDKQNKNNEKPSVFQACRFLTKTPNNKNLTIFELLFSNENKNKGNHIITTKIEHDCVLNSCKFLEEHGFKVIYLGVDENGFIDLKELEKEINEKTILVSIIHGNNEIGVIQELEKIGKICRKHDVYFHTDACQSYTKTEIDVKKQNLDLVTLNAHKIHGPKGVGVLYVKKGTKINALIHGGGQEKNLRSGTENIPAIVGFAKAVELAKPEHIKQMTRLRDYFIDEILKIPGTKLNGSKKNRLCNNLNVSFKYIEGESIVSMLDEKGICVSTGSACSSHTLEPSHVIMALENNPERAHGSVRFTISRFTTKNEIDFTLKELKKVVEKLRRISPFKE